MVTGDWRRTGRTFTFAVSGPIEPSIDVCVFYFTSFYFNGSCFVVGRIFTSFLNGRLEPVSLCVVCFERHVSVHFNSNFLQWNWNELRLKTNDALMVDFHR